MKYLFLLISLLLMPQQGIAQKSFSDEFKYKAIYKLTYQPDSTDANSVRSEFMILYLGEKISRFSSAERSRGDSILRHRKRNRLEFTGRFQGAPQTKFDYYVFKGIPEGELSYTRKIVKDNFRYVQDLDLFNWEIQPETKEVSGYQAQKATTNFSGREYTAWFTSEIPIPEGPHKFNGLPELIVEIRDQKDHYSFVLTEFKEIEGIPFDFTTKDYNTTNQRKCKEVVEKYNFDPFAAMERYGMKIHFTPEQEREAKKEVKEKFEKYNNLFELK
ncbi:GLPGLI family protein [Salinimicrobium marinum]|nr:GLPGLI family protein [Salinimicrobium marinum]